MSNFDDLPLYDLSSIIFKHLNLDDLIKCRLVSKKFKECVDNFKIKSIVVSDKTFRSSRNWFGTKEKLRLNRYVVSSKSKFLTTTIFDLQQTLRRLYYRVCSKYDCEDFSLDYSSDSFDSLDSFRSYGNTYYCDKLIDKLNKFTGLNYLEVSSPFSLRFLVVKKLKLPNLQVLFFHLMII